MKIDRESPVLNKRAASFIPRVVVNRERNRPVRLQELEFCELDKVAAKDVKILRPLLVGGEAVVNRLDRRDV